jgi:hypothetical protein
MKQRTTRETTVICVAGVAAVALLMIPFEVNTDGRANGSADLVVWVVAAAVAALGMVLYFRYLTVKKKAQVELTGGDQYRQLADEYRRLADLAITAQEHTDLKLGDVSVHLDYLREQSDSLRKILKEVE